VREPIWKSNGRAFAIFREMARSCSKEALGVLLRVMRDADAKPEARTRAAEAVLAWSWGRPENALEVAGGSDVMGCRPTVAGTEDGETAALRGVLTHWPRLAPDGATLRTAVGALWTRERIRGESLPPDGFDDLREALEALAPPRPGMAPDAHKLGNALRRSVGRIVGGRKLVSRAGHGGVAVWRVLNRGES
jgi:hypothetical protein